MLDKAQLDAIRARCEVAMIAKRDMDAAPPGIEQQMAGLHFLAVAVLLTPDVPALLAEVERLQAIVERKAARPTIVCLCGSTRYMEAFFAAAWGLTLEGQIVLSVGVCKHTDQYGAHGAEAAGVAERLDELHKRKIDLADWVLVLNIGGYYGSSTASEIDYAARLGKPVRYISDLPRGAPVDASFVSWDAVQADAVSAAAEAAKEATP